jgi:hypothetical protein
VGRVGQGWGGLARGGIDSFVNHSGKIVGKKSEEFFQRSATMTDTIFIIGG